jgi:hypothetical protein
MTEGGTEGRTEGRKDRTEGRKDRTEGRKGGTEGQDKRKDMTEGGGGGAPRFRSFFTVAVPSFLRRGKGRRGKEEGRS